MDASKGSKRSKKQAILLVVSCVLLVVVVSMLTVLFMQKKGDSAADTKAISERIIKKVNVLYLLPTEETPTVAKIQDKNSIQGNQEFYKNAQNGDFLLVYQEEKIALIYREAINKLISVRPVTATTERNADR